ncbi:MAG TPA: (4Fe-4S)-binding protein, partial [bacterium]|nr:(4Fe-4S)-binding protein [bacterium]
MIAATDLKELARSCGADLTGIASARSFDFLPPESNPRFIQPQARSVIVLGFRIPRGALRGVEEGTAWQTMAGATPFPTAAICVETTYRLARYLESEGWETVPLFAHSSDLQHQGVAVSPDKPEPNVILPMDIAAHAAGLGEIGRGRFFLTPEFGPRQLFTALVTDLELEPDKIFSG